MPLQLSMLVRVVNHELGWSREILESRYIGGAVKQSKVCSVWGLCEICFSLCRNLALSVLAIGFTSKHLWNNQIKVNLCQTSILQYFASCMEN